MNDRGFYLIFEHCNINIDWDKYSLIFYNYAKIKNTVN
jgi:hypothetical protein